MTPFEKRDLGYIAVGVVVVVMLIVMYMAVTR